LFEPSRYKVTYGGRGAGKSWGIARALLILGTQKKLRILCARETMKSIEESVHQTLTDQIAALSLGDFYRVQLKNIVGANGTEFFFAGVRQSVENIKSYEDVDICWCEEAQSMSKRSLSILIPTIRKESSEIWFSFNPEFEDDEVYKMFISNAHDLAKVVNINWRDNPWFTGVLQREMEALRKRDADECDHVYEGTLRSTVEGAIYKKEIQAAEKEQRVARVPWDSAHPVHTFWDLGFGDATAIWFAQSIGFEFRIIDYESGELNALSHYVKQLKERPYAYGVHWLPWDGAAKELGTGRSVEEQLADHFGKGSVRCAKKLSVEDGIAATRAIFSKCYFDAARCKDGLRGLRCYQYEYDKDLRTYSRKPLHDWASHPADGFRTLGVAIKEQAPQKAKPAPSGTGTRGVRYG
jgi:phage terminase large subunit